MPDSLLVARVRVRGATYAILPALDLPIRYAGGLWRVECPLLCLTAYSQTHAGLRAAFGEQLHIAYHHLVLATRADLSPAEQAIRAILAYRITYTPPLPYAPSACPKKCMGGQACRCSQKDRP